MYATKPGCTCPLAENLGLSPSTHVLDQLSVTTVLDTEGTKHATRYMQVKHVHKNKKIKKIAGQW